jgi:hypothetical protein
MIRTIAAGLVGGVLMFLWAGFAHTATPLGHQGIEELPQEAATLAALSEQLGEADGFFYFPGFGLGHHPTMEEKKAGMAAYKEKLQTSPRGLLVYHQPGTAPPELRYYLAELGFEMVEAIFAALLVAWAGIGGFLRRVGFVAVIGLIAAVTTNGSYWNWYGFPLDYTLAYALIQFVGFIVAGVAIAMIVKKPAR